MSGEAAAVRCGACGLDAAAGAKFCRKCGKPLHFEGGGDAEQTLGPSAPPIARAPRSAAITSLGVVNAVAGSLVLLAGLLALAWGIAARNDSWSGLILLIGGALSLLGGFKTAAGVCLVKRRPWARWWFLFEGGLSAVWLLGRFVLMAKYAGERARVGPDLSQFASAAVSGGWCAWTFYALLGERRKEEFRR